MASAIDSLARTLIASRDAFEEDCVGLVISPAIFQRLHPSSNDQIAAIAVTNESSREVTLRGVFFMKTMTRLNELSEIVREGGTVTTRQREERRRCVQNCCHHQSPPFRLTTQAPPLTIAPGDTVAITISCVMPNVGIARDVMVMHFDGDRSIARYLTGRHAGSAEQAAAVDALQPTSKYRRRRGQQMGAQLRRRAEVVQAPRLPKKKGKKRRGKLRGQGRKLPNAYIPAGWQPYMPKGQTDTHPAIASYRDSLDGYAERFKHLLWAEERAATIALEKYRLKGAALKNTGRRFVLQVDGLAEKRPSLLPGDDVLLGRSRSGGGGGGGGGGQGGGGRGGTTFKARIEAIALTAVTLVVSERALQEHRPAWRYDVDFVLHRLPLRLHHRGITLAAKLTRPSFLFPTRADLEPQRLRASRLEDAFGSHAPSLHFENAELNAEQRAAVRAIVEGRARDVPFLIFGPPGTGKTVTLVEAVKQLVLRDVEARILVCAPTNYAADLICERLHALDVLATPRSAMVRMMARSRRAADGAIPAAVLAHCAYNRAERAFDAIDLRALLDARVVVATLGAASKLCSYEGVGVGADHFDCIVVDEAGQATEPEVLGAAAPLIGPETQLILAGDPQQLGPVILSSAAKKHGLGVSLLERLFARDVYRCANDDSAGAEAQGGSGGAPRALVESAFEPLVFAMLTANYRSHRALLVIPNERFYAGRLRAVSFLCFYCEQFVRILLTIIGLAPSPNIFLKLGDAAVTCSLESWAELPAPGVPLIFHAVRGENLREASSPSWFNPDEAVLVVDYVCRLQGDL